MNSKIFSLLWILAFSTQLAAQTPSMKSTLYAKRLVTNYHLDLSQDSPLDFQNYRGGFELTYGQSFGKNMNVVFPFKTTVFRAPEATTNQRYFSLGAQLHLHHNINKTFSPYVLGGAGVIILPGERGEAQIPLGAGINIRLNPNLGINLQTEYRISIDDKDQNHYQNGLGLYFNFGGAPKTEVVEEIITIPAPDRDEDSIVDSLDLCPDIAGLAAFGGCPDSDGDGISDQTDACPDLAGPKEFNGCPDTDGDGFSDVDDDCPDTPGKNQGCPPSDRDGDGVSDDEDECPDQKGSLRGCPDRDGDGVADATDRCPDLAGPINAKGCPDTDGDGLDDANDMCPNKAGSLANKGCPEIAAADKATLEFAMQAVNFKTASAQLTIASYATLDQIADILGRYPDYNLVINGHTDNVGEATGNLNLSQRRAESCRDYLMSKGISSIRMTPIGFGEEQPRVSNDTADGKRMNRRVEFEMKLK